MKKDIRLVTYNPQNNLYSFDWNSSSTDIRGREKLVQDIIKRILTERGSNVFDPQYGENFYNLYGVIDPSREQEVKEGFPLLLKNMQDDIIAEQSLDDTLTSREKLVSLNLREIEFDQLSGSWLVKIAIQTEDRVTSTFTI